MAQTVGTVVISTLQTWLGCFAVTMRGVGAAGHGRSFGRFGQLPDAAAILATPLLGPLLQVTSDGTGGDVDPAASEPTGNAAAAEEGKGHLALSDDGGDEVGIAIERRWGRDGGIVLHVLVPGG
jgi:hypothetical protein